MQPSTPSARWSFWQQRTWLHGILVGLLVSSILVNAASAFSPTSSSFPGKLILQDGKLTARIIALPLWQVMEEASRVSNAQVRWLNPRGEEVVSVEFTALPLLEALRRLLAGKNFMFFYTATPEGERLTQVWISSLEQGDTPQVFTSPIPAEEKISETAQTASEEQAEGDTTLLDTFMQLAVYDQNASIRLAAIMDLEAHAQENPKIIGVLSYLEYNDSDPQVQKAAAEALRRLE